MKIYPSNNLQPVNSIQRKATEVIIPPVNFKGKIKPSVSDRWPIPKDLLITGGKLTSRTVGTGSNSFSILKNNIFEQNEVVGTATLSATDQVALFTLSDSLTGALTLSKYDWLTVAAFGSSGHQGIVVQVYAVEIN